MVGKRFKKSMLRVGTYFDSEGTPVPVTPARLKHWKSRHDALVANNYVVPIHWDHAENPAGAVPLSVDDFKDKKKRTAANTVGILADFKVNEAGDAAELTFDLRTKAAQEAAETNVVHVSPVIFKNWSDGSGQKHEDVITTVDLVNHPVDHSQSEFKAADPVPGTIALGLRMGLDEQKPVTLFLGMDEEEEESEEPADDFDFEETDGPPAPEPQIESDNDDIMKASKMKQLLAELAESMAANNMTVPKSDPDEDSLAFVRELALIMEQKMMDAEMPGDQPETPVDDEELDMSDLELDNDLEEEEEVTVTSPEFAAMQLSLDAQKNEAEQAKREAAAAQAQAKSHANRLIRMSKDATKSELIQLAKTGRITPAEEDQWVKWLDAAKLSLGDDGEPKKSDIDFFLEARRSLPDGAVWDSVQRLSQANVVRPPEEMTGELDAESIKRLNDQFAKTSDRKGMYRREAAAS